MAGPVPKQYRELAGVPMLLHSVRAFLQHPEVASIVIALPPGDETAPPAWLREVEGRELHLVAGGPERSDSVALALAGLTPACRTVLVHDGARPLVDRATIDRVIAMARTGVGAVPAIPLSDTVKEVGPEDQSLTVRGTVPRQHLWRAQTPQGFPRSTLEEAHARARAERIRVTDDAMLLEQAGGTVRLVDGSPLNFKITTEEDFRMAELILRET
jgi:2-C-methyl-D-erythritol 4-phosphate cytidylyltransferase